MEFTCTSTQWHDRPIAPPDFEWVSTENGSTTTPSLHRPSWRSSEKTAILGMLSVSKGLRPEKLRVHKRTWMRCHQIHRASDVGACRGCWQIFLELHGRLHHLEGRVICDYETPQMQLLQNRISQRRFSKIGLKVTCCCDRANLHKIIFRVFWPPSLGSANYSSLSLSWIIGRACS
jgi:hypothetical protein